jgi:hypothetical protein
MTAATSTYYLKENNPTLGLTLYTVVLSVHDHIRDYSGSFCRVRCLSVVEVAQASHPERGVR